MRGFMALVGVALLCGLGAVASAQSQLAGRTPSVHRTACDLGDSMAGKLHFKDITAEKAKETCQQLAPDMDDTNRAEYLRCCTTRLQSGNPAAGKK